LLREPYEIVYDGLSGLDCYVSRIFFAFNYMDSCLKLQQLRVLLILPDDPDTTNSEYSYYLHEGRHDLRASIVSICFGFTNVHQVLTPYITMTTSAPTLPLLRGTTTLEAALEQEENMLLDLAYPEQRLDFFVWLNTHRADIEGTVSYHLGLTGSEICRLGEVGEWIHGSFNVCIPVYVDNWKKHPGRRVIVRFPLPYKVGESTFPGNIDEKLRCEAATYIWVREHCPHVPIPHLWGFGFVGGQSVWNLHTF
jgi:hypothetical protein